MVTQLCCVSKLSAVARAVSASLDVRWYCATAVDIAMERVAKRNLSNPGWESLTMEQARQRVAANDAVNAQLVDRSGLYADLAFVVSDDLS